MFDAPLLGRLRLSATRLVFPTETLGEPADGRPIELRLGDPVDVLHDRSVAVTFAPLPGFRARAGRIQPVDVHPWPWLVGPAAGSVASFSA